ncbi:MAG: PEGA domain-containing protein, partial [Myxococcales bacterium]|nr:PEGA domain-containing protein [Myxococcales bacterium]
RSPLLSLLLLVTWISFGGVAEADEGSVEARKVAVLPLVVEGSIDADARASLTERLRSGLERGEFAIAPQGEVDNLAESPCDRQTCYGKLRSQLGVSHLVRATVTIKNRDYDMKVELIDAENGNVVASSQDRCDICGLEEVGEQIASQGALLRAKIDAMGSGPAILALESKPSGATVSIDGEIVGSTPLERSVIAGAHVVRLTLDGYAPEEREVTFVAGVTETISFELSRAAGNAKTRLIGIASLATGIAFLGGGIAMLVMDDVMTRSTEVPRIPDWKCVGGKDAVKDADGDCEKYYNFSLGGGILVGAGAALTTAGAMIIHRHRGTKQTLEARAGIGPFGLSLSGRF